MQRSPGAAPGGPKSKSEAKKARLQSLSQVLGGGAGPGAQQQQQQQQQQSLKRARADRLLGGQPVPPDEPQPPGRRQHTKQPGVGPDAQHPKQDRVRGGAATQKAGIANHVPGTWGLSAQGVNPGGRAAAAPGAEGVTRTGGGDAGVGEPPYNTLDESIAGGPLARILRAAGGAPSLQPSGRPPTPAAALDGLVEALLRTNPSLKGSADARAAAGLRVQDKSILLDNPPGRAQAKAGARQPPGFSKQLMAKRKAPAATVIKQGDVRFSQLLPFHHLWQRYICSQLDAVLPPANPAHSHLQLQQQQQRKRRKQTPEASQPPQQQQQQQQQQQCNNPSVEATMRALVPLASSAPPQPAARQLSPAQVMAARTQLSQCELHGSVLQVVRCPNPQLVGASGVVALITSRAVCLVDSDDRVRVVPKRGAKFACDLSSFGLAWAALYEGEAIG